MGAEPTKTDASPIWKLQYLLLTLYSKIKPAAPINQWGEDKHVHLHRYIIFLNKLTDSWQQDLMCLDLPAAIF